MSAERLFDLTGKIAVVTGAGDALGADIAETLADAGADVVAAGVERAAAERTAAAVRDAGRRALALECDPANEASVHTAFDAAVDTFGRVDILCNNVNGTGQAPEPVHRFDSAHWRQVVCADLGGMFYCTKAALKIMGEQRSGKIVQIVPMPRARDCTGTAYAAARGAVFELTGELGSEQGVHGIRINALCPADAEADIRGAALFLAAPASDCLTGQHLVVGG